MDRKYFDWKLAIVVVIGLVIVGATAYGLRQWQRSSRSENALKIGNKAYEEKEWEEAAINLGRYIAVNSNDISVLLKYADAQLNIRPLKTNNLQQAIGAYRNILRIEKGNLEAAMQLAKLYLEMRIPGETELIAQRALEVNQDAELRRMLALSFAGQRKLTEAVSELKGIIESNPHYVPAYETLWQLTKQRLGGSSESSADRWLDMAVENNPSSALAYIIRASSYLAGKNLTGASADLDQAETLDLSDSKVRLRLIIGFINANAIDRAEKHLKILRDIEPANQALWQIWAKLVQKTGPEEKMLEIAETGLKELASQRWDFMLTAVELFIQCNKLDRAAECISQLRQKDIDPSTVAFYEGLVAERKGLHFEAMKCWQRAIQSDNKSPRVRLALASGFSRAGDNQSAMQELRTLISENPDFLDGYLALARLLAKNGNWTQAAEYANRAMQLSPDNLDAALLHLQTQIELLTAGAESQSVKDIEKQLSAAEKAAGGAVSVQLLQLRLAIKLGNFSNAETLIIKLKQDNQDNLKIALAEVELLIAKGKTNEAISMLNSVIAQFPETVEPITTLVFLLAQQNNREKCETVIKDALIRIKQPEAQRRLSLLLIQFYTEWKQQDKAYDLLAALALKFPDDISIKRQLMAFEMMNKNIASAQRCVDDIKAIEGENGWQWRYEQARIWFDSNDFKNRYDQVVLLLRENLIANQGDQASRILLAATYEKGGNPQLALSAYRQAMEKSPHDIRIIIPVIAALYRAKEYDEADRILNHISVEKLYHPDLQALQLQSYLRKGQLDSASGIMNELLTKDPNDKALTLSFALLKMRQGDFSHADILLAKLKTMNPDALPVIVAQIQSNMFQGKNQEAIQICDETVAKLKNAEAYIIRAKTFISLKQIDKAIEDMEYIAASEPDNINVWISRSDFFRSIGQPDKAAVDINRAILMAPDNPAVQKRAVSLYLTSNNPDVIRQGRTILDKALETNPEDIELLLYKASLLIEDGTDSAVADAAGILKKMTEGQPHIEEAWVMSGNLLLKQGQSSKAMDTALRGLVNNPNSKSLLMLKADVEAGQSPVLAIPTLKSLRDMEPNDLDVTIKLANMYVGANEYANAVNLLEKQLGICADDASRQRCNAALAVAMFKNGKKDEAEKILTSLSKSDPNNNLIVLIQINLLKEDGRYADIMAKVTDWFERHPNGTRTLIAIAEGLMAEGNTNKKSLETAENILRMVIAKMPEHALAIQTLAIVMQTGGHNIEAAKLNQQLLDINPKNVIAMNNLAWILCEEQGKCQQAIELAEKGLQLSPQYVDLIDTRGVAYYRLGKYDKAIEDFMTCLKLYPAGASGRVGSFFHLARAFSEIGEKDKALEYLKETLNIQNQSGGLSPKDLDEAQRLLKVLSKEI